MALINCPECNTEVSDQAVMCPKCAYPLSNTSNVTISEPLNENLTLSDSSLNWKHVSWVSYLVIGLLFLLPFCDINCSGKKMISFTGIELVTGTTITPSITGNEFKQQTIIPANILAILAFVSIIIGLIVSIVHPRTNILSCLLGMVCAITLVFLQLFINQQVTDTKLNLFSVSYLFPYWLALLGSISIMIVNFATVHIRPISRKIMLKYSFITLVILVIYTIIFLRYNISDSSIDISHFSS